MKDNNFTPEDSLATIDKAIASFRKNYRESSVMFLLWGWILSLASFSSFFILRELHAREAYGKMGMWSMINWGSFLLVGSVLMLIYLRKEKRKQKVVSYLDGYIQKLWGAAALSFGVATVLCIILEIDPPPLMLLITALATTATGLMVKFTPLTLGGISFFVTSIVSVLVVREYVALVTGFAIVIGYLVPGYMLRFAKE